MRRLQPNQKPNFRSGWSKAYFLVAVLSAVLLLVPARIEAQTVWTHVSDQPVLDYGDAGQWEDYGIWPRSVIKDGDTLRMWYAGADADPFSGGGIWNIGYAWSLDGVSWNRYAGNPVMSPELSWEGVHVADPTVIKDGDTLRMWYGGDLFPTAIGYAASVDGINWTKHPNSLLQGGPAGAWDSDDVWPATVVKEDGGYKLWYNGVQGTSAIIQTGLATSTDGLQWVKYDDPSTTAAPYAESDPVLKVSSGAWDSRRVWGPAVLPTATGYEMWYSGWASGGQNQWVGYATSADADGISWIKWPDNPVIATHPPWGYEYLTATVLQFDGLYHLWYAGFDSQGTRTRPRIGYATSLPGLLEVTVSPTTYVVPGSDSVSVTAFFTGDTTALALFAVFQAADQTTLDSIRLYDDGAHRDGVADDSLFGNVWPLPAGERLYLAGLKATLNATEIINYKGLARFTTIGPLEHAGDSLALAPNIDDPNYHPRLYLKLRNAGSVATATGITARLSALDTSVTDIKFDIADFGDIPAGDVVLSSGPLSSGYIQVSLNLNYSFDTEVPFALSISSDGHASWSDTIAITFTWLGIADAGGVLPKTFALHQNYPNPFNPVSTLRFDLPQGSHVNLVIYDLRGREVAGLVDSYMKPGSHPFQWDSRNNLGKELPSGIYIARLVTPDYTKSIKMVLLK